MCLLAWNWQPHSDDPLLLIGNRDEFYARPTRELHWWSDTQKGSDILAGRDLQAGGTWLGISRSGRVAAVTNFRNGLSQRKDAVSRGELVTNFLSGNLGAAETLGQLIPKVADYNPFNLLVFDGTLLLGLESRKAHIVTMVPGVGGVSNADFDTPWPKLQTLTRALAPHTRFVTPDTSPLFALLQNTTQAQDAELPSTGIELSLERALSPIFIRTPHYGTRSSSVVMVRSTHVDFLERQFDAQGPTGQVEFSFERG